MQVLKRATRRTLVGAAAGVGLTSIAIATGLGGSSIAETRPAVAVPAAALALQQAFVASVKALEPSVVEILTSSGLGSGVVYDAKGDIVTNAHVVGSAASFTVALASGRRVQARLVGTYAPDDLAVIRATSSVGLKPARFANSSTISVGALVLAIGSPLGLSSSVTDGIVSFNGRTVTESSGVVLPNLIQTSAAINPGNSGGALVDLSQQVVGIPTLGIENQQAGGAAAGIGFAIASNTVKLIAPQLIATGKVTRSGRAALGITAATATDAAGAPIGVVVTAVSPGGPASRVGLSAGDVITAINKVPTPDLTALETALSVLRPGSRAQLSLRGSGGALRTVVVILADLASS